MRNNLDGDVAKSYRTNTHLCLNVFCVSWHLAVTYSLIKQKYNSNSLAAVLQINKSNATGNSKRLHTPGVHIRTAVDIWWGQYRCASINFLHNCNGN